MIKPMFPYYDHPRVIPECRVSPRYSQGPQNKIKWKNTCLNFFKCQKILYILNKLQLCPAARKTFTSINFSEWSDTLIKSTKIDKNLMIIKIWLWLGNWRFSLEYWSCSFFSFSPPPGLALFIYFYWLWVLLKDVCALCKIIIKRYT